MAKPNQSKINLNEVMLRENCGYQLIRVLSVSKRDQVLEVKSLNSGKHRIIKILDAIGEGVFNPTEVSIPSTIKSPYIFSFYNLMNSARCGSKGGVSIFMEKSDVDSFSHIKSMTRLLDKLTMIYEAMCGLQALHLNQTLHLDLKIDNLLIYNGRSHLIDFGLSVKVDDIERGINRREILGTTCYMPPEHLSKKSGLYNYSAKTDIWTMGHLILIILAYKTLIRKDYAKSRDETNEWLTKHFTKKEDRINAYQSLTMHLGYSAEIMDHVYKLLETCFQPNPKDRGTISDLMSSPLFDLVKDKVKTEYMVISPPRIESAYDYTNTLILMDELLKAYLGDEDARLLFIAFDLFHRVAGMVDDMGQLNSRVREVVFNRVGYTCIWIAYKSIYFQYKRSIDRVFNRIKQIGGGESQYYRNTESSIIVYLKGVILPNYIYESCQGRNHLLMSYDRLLFDPELYNRIDLKSWVKQMGESEGDKHLPISDLKYSAYPPN